MRRHIGALWLLGVLAVGGPAWAKVGTIDDVPAATLLLPYFEVNLADSQGTNTIFTVNNASPIAAVVRVVIWSDLSVPVLGFHVYLTGYDVQVVDLRQVLQGHLPKTASDGQDVTDTISPQGPFSQDINFASCNGILPPADPIPLSQLNAVRAGLTGNFSSAFGGCVGLPSGSVARGYVTMDTVNNCTPRVPGDVGYFGPGGSGDATNQNILWGDYVQVNRRRGTARGDTLVHIEASATDPETSVAGEYTFYGRYVNWTAVDNREPLATTFAVRHTKAAPFDEGTDLIVWRDSKVVQGPFACGSRPAWFPLGQEQIVAFDEQEEPALPASTRPFPAEAQRVKVGGHELPVAFTSGWIFLNLNTAVSIAGENPPEDPAAAQAWVSAEHRGSVFFGLGAYSVGYRAIQLDSATQAAHETIP